MGYIFRLQWPGKEGGGHSCSFTPHKKCIVCTFFTRGPNALSVSANPSCVSRLPARQAAACDSRARPRSTLAQRRPLCAFALGQPRPCWTCGGPSPSGMSTATIARAARCADDGGGRRSPCSSRRGRGGRAAAPGRARS